MNKHANQHLTADIFAGANPDDVAANRAASPGLGNNGRPRRLMKHVLD